MAPIEHDHFLITFLSFLLLYKQTILLNNYMIWFKPTSLIKVERRQEHQAMNTQYSTIFCATSTDLKKSVTISLDHHTYNELKDCQDSRSSKPQPFNTVKASMHTRESVETCQLIYRHRQGKRANLEIAISGNRKLRFFYLNLCICN